ILINLDSEEEGVALASCAGGVRNTVSLPVEWTTCPIDDCASFEVVISGLKGGHSGVEIDKNRANANKLLGRLLHVLTETVTLSVSSVKGGEKMNAIPKRAMAMINVSSSQVESLKEAVKVFEEMVRVEFAIADAGIRIDVKPVATAKKVFSNQTMEAMISILQLMPYGPQTMSENVKGLVESSNNIGVLETLEQSIEFNSAVRSSVGSLKGEINHRIQTIANLTGATMTLTADYPEWQFATESKIRDIMKEVYKKTTGQELVVTAIHAGLECGFLSEKLGAIDMISIGPEMHDVHTPKECLSISSTERVYKFLCEVLKEIK
ncbi:MAG: beta-Ala-His dipeptidase, partial [Turicibacter sp.]